LSNEHTQQQSGQRSRRKGTSCRQNRDDRFHLQWRYTAMFNTILVAVDESAAAKEAARVAVELAGLDHDAVLLANVVDVAKLVSVAGYDTPYPVETVKILTDAGQRLLDETKAAYASSGLIITTALGEGDAIDELVRLASESSAGLICIGTHGRTGLARLFVGSVAEGVLRAAQIPVLVVHPA
jgi:nucleotide-binding universal stress UspA family protein